MIVLHRRGRTSEWEAADLLAAQKLAADPNTAPSVILKNGEFAIEERDDGSRYIKIGDGKTLFKDLPYIDKRAEAKAEENLQKARAALLTNLDSRLVAEKSAREAADKNNFEALTTLVDNKTSELRAEFEAADINLAANISSVEQQSAKAVSNILKQLESIGESIHKLGQADGDLISKIYEVNNTLSSITSQLSNELSVLETHYNITHASVLKEVKNQEEARISADHEIISAMLEYITKIYIELADLVDDDILILEKAFSVENSLNAKINALEKSFIEDFENIEQLVHDVVMTKITEVDKRLEESITEAAANLSESVESLRSETNVQLNSAQKSISALTNTIRVTKNELEAQVSETKAAIDANRTETAEEIAAVEADVAAANLRIDGANAAIEAQSKRISNLITYTPDGTVKDSELVDIRSGYNGLTHTSAGDAVRAIGNDLEALKNSLPDYIPSNAVDGLLYENSQLYLTSKGETVGEPVLITGGGGGGSISTVKVTNNLASTSFAVAKGNPAIINFTYTSVENGIPTGDGNASIIINDKLIDALSCTVHHGVAKTLNVADYLSAGSNKIKITCYDTYGSSRSLVYTISVIELRIESKFDSTRIYNDTIQFRYKVYGQVEKFVNILIDGEEFSSIKLGASVHGSESTIFLPKQSHGCHKLTAFISTTINDNEIKSNILEYDILCLEADEKAAMIASVYDITEVIQGDLVSIPYMIYDPSNATSSVDLIVYSQVAGELIEVDRTSATADRMLQYWNTRKYPIGKTVFAISYTYTLYGETRTITKSHTVNVRALDVDVSAETDSLQLYLTAQGRANNETNPATWTFTPDASTGNTTTITTSFEKFNWKSNGWVVDDNGDACLRLNGDARAVINFKPFKEDFKLYGKTIEFEFAVRDVNSRDTVVIDCYSNGRGFKATPDTAFLQSSGTNVSCRYKDEERVRVAISVEHSDSESRLVSIYLDGILSGVQRYATTDDFSQDPSVNITLGSSVCGLDVYAIRVYNKALSTAQILENYIADQADPTTKLKLFTDNDVLNEETEKLSYERVKALGQIPIITFTGQMPTYKGDKKKKSVRMKFEDPANPELNFDVLLDQIDVQGTSSQFYVRKNWKVKLPEARPHMPGAIPAKVYCIKVDYAEATGTHNTGCANYVETLYDRNEVTLPPQKDDARVRTTIQGFPVVLFEKATEDSEPVFSSKGNFNYDKDAENAFGFTDDYEDFGVECWEFCNNTSDSCNFAGSIQADWQEDFEPRYVPKSANYERIEELLEQKDAAAKGQGTFTQAQQIELSALQTDCIANFKAMHDWVLSTATYKIVDGNRVPLVPTALAKPVVYGGVTYTEDNEEYRLAKFKNEFKDYFNLHYCSIYYVFTFFALMVDQRAKNMFLTRWKDSDGVFRWYPYFYDNDTIFGINNEGALVFDYYHEDIDQLGSSNVYNGQNSVLWTNFRSCFPQYIQSTYAKLRQGPDKDRPGWNAPISYEKVINQFVVNGSDRWSAAIYNEDADYKYITMARPDPETGKVDASNLYQVRGPGEHHLRYFISNRLDYCDSKWYAGTYPTDYIFMRIYTPVIKAITEDMTEEKKAEISAANARIEASLRAVPANPNITLTPFSNVYAGVRYMAGGILQQARLAAGEEHVFTPPLKDDGSTMTFSDTETAIYGASGLSSLGDLSGLYPGVISVGSADKLVELIIGNADPAYYNDNFREISVGSNRLLKKIDLRNCFGLGIAGESPQETLDLSGCANIEEVYTEGTNLKAVALPDGGYVKILHLPASTNNINIRNQQHIEDFSIESYANIRTLCIDSCPTLNTNEILAACISDGTVENGKYTVDRVRLTGINWTFDNADFIKSLYPEFDEDGNFISGSGLRGIDEKNNNINDAYLAGTCHIKELTGAEYAEIKKHYPVLALSFDKMTSNVSFNYTDAEGTAHVEVVPIHSVNSQLGDLTGHKTDYAPAWPENAAFTYEFVGWSRKKQVSNGIEDSENDYLAYVQADALKDIVGDRVLYPVFKARRKSYPVVFINPTAPEGKQELAIVITPYGSDAVYTGETPIKLNASSPELYEHVGWHPAPTNITGPIQCYAQFALLDDMWYTLGLEDITYSTNESAKTLQITKCLNKLNPAIRVPATFDKDGASYKTIKVDKFSEYTDVYTKLELLNLPDTLEVIGIRAFYMCDNLFELKLPKELQTIGQGAFERCSRITTVYIPAKVSSIGSEAFYGCPLESMTVDPENTKYTMVEDCLMENGTKLVKGLSTGNIPTDTSELVAYCFASTGITSANIPDCVTEIPSNAFYTCTMLEDLHLPAELVELKATCFGNCFKLRNVSLPDKLTTIGTFVFNNCAIEHIVIPASVKKISENAFGNMPSLKTVTFEPRFDEAGNIVAPSIDHRAFNGSGTSGLVFNVPWSEDYDYKYTFDGKPYVSVDDTQAWGATNFVINYNHKEA